jgi:DNA primase
MMQSEDAGIEIPIMDDMGTWFHDNLMSLANDHPAIIDLNKRRIPRDLPILGWVPDSRSMITRLGVDDRTKLMMLKSGLVDTKRDSMALQSFAENRLTIMVRDDQGTPIRFWARSYDPDAKTKYVSSRFTSYDHKDVHLFFADEAKSACAATGEIYVLEGQFDTISTHLSGMKNAIGAGGCDNFYQPEFDKCMELTGNGRIIICMDSDESGIRGMRMVMNRFPDADIRVCVLPVGMDPCSLRAESGDTDLRNALRHHISMSEFMTTYGAGSSQHVRHYQKPYKERRRWVKALQGASDPEPVMGIKERCSASKGFRLLAGIKAAAIRENRVIPDERMVMPKLLRGDISVEEAADYGDRGSFDDLMEQARTTIWKKLSV